MTNENIRFYEVLANEGECNCRVEYHEYSAPYPIGSAYVTTRTFDRRPILYFVMVADQQRRQGIGTALIRACEQRWPDIYVTEGISDGGTALLQSANVLESNEEI